MEWVYGLGLVILVAVGVAVLAAGSSSPGEGSEADEQPYQWGDELHEYSYRHPWEDE